MHAIELLDRYDEVQGQLVTIDAWSIPNAFYGNQILQYARVPPKAAVMGRTVGVHFDREIRPGVLIYDVMAVDPHGDFMQGTDVRQVGQIAVQMSTPGIYPDVFQSWDVEPRGTLEGTTEGGLVVRIPLVRFWRYHDSGLDAGKPIQISIPPQPHGTPSDPHQDSAVIPLGPDALRFKVLGLHAGMKKTDAVEQLSHVAFQGIGCEEEGTDSEHCQYKSDSGEEVKAVYFRDELLHLDYKFPYSEFERIRVSLVVRTTEARFRAVRFLLGHRRRRSHPSPHDRAR
jgi:hypothetical protein